MTNKTVPTKVSFSDYLGSLPDEKRRIEAEQLAAVMVELSGEQPMMWGPSIVGLVVSHGVV